MWHAYNLVTVGDSIKSTTIRKVKDETATGSSTASRVRTTLTLSVENIEFDTSVCELRVKGRNIQENQYVKVREIYLYVITFTNVFLFADFFYVQMGAYHTIDLQMNQKFTLAKLHWDYVTFDRLG